MLFAYGRFLERRYLLRDPKHRWAFSKELIYQMKVEKRTKKMKREQNSLFNFYVSNK